MSISLVEWRIARRYLWSRKNEGFLSLVVTFAMVGIGLGVATLIVVMAVMNGFRSELMTRILGMNGHAMVHMSRAIDPASMRDRLTQMPIVEQATPIIDGQTIITHHGQHHGVMVRGIDFADLAKNHFLKETFAAPLVPDTDTSASSIVIGATLATLLNVTVGDEVTLISPQSVSTLLGGLPRMKRYRIANIFTSDMHHYDRQLIFMPLDQATGFFRKSHADYLELRLTDPFLPNHSKNEMRMRLLDVPLVRITDWRDHHGALFSALAVERRVMFLILMLIILTAVFNIITGLSILVRDKEREVAILRTIGMTRRGILRIFIVHGMTIGVIGTVVGGGLGLAFALHIETIRQSLEALFGMPLFPQEIYFLSTIPSEPQVGETALVVAMALLFSFLASYYPAWRAASLAPAQTLSMHR